MYDTDLRLLRIVSPEGSTVAERVAIDEALSVQKGAFDRRPDKEDFEGFTGNEGASAMHFYREMVC